MSAKYDRGTVGERNSWVTTGTHTRGMANKTSVNPSSQYVNRVVDIFGIGGPRAFHGANYSVVGAAREC